MTDTMAAVQCNDLGSVELFSVYKIIVCIVTVNLIISLSNSTEHILFCSTEIQLSPSFVDDKGLPSDGCNPAQQLEEYRSN